MPSPFRAVPLSPAPSTHPGPLPALRAATRTHHERIDRVMNLPRLHESARYGRILQAMAAFLELWEHAVGAALPAGWDDWLHARSRRPFLDRDLLALGLPPLAAPARMPALPNAAAAWGSLYVIEGSALGSQLITRQLAACGLDADHGGAYFQGWGDATGGMWREFRSLLESELGAPGTLADACAAACETFDLLTELLETALDERLAAA